MRVLAALVVMSVAWLVTTPRIFGIDHSDGKKGPSAVCVNSELRVKNSDSVLPSTHDDTH